MPENNLNNFEFHINNFNIQESKCLKIFYDYIKLVDNVHIELSCKVKASELFPCRFNIWYNNNYTTNLNSCIQLIKKYDQLDYDINIDPSRFFQIINSRFEMNRVGRLILGVDFRENLPDSRIKLWLALKNYPGFIIDILKQGKFDPYMIKLVQHNMFLFGFDFCFNGNCYLKVYPVLFKQDFANPLIKAVLNRWCSKRSVELMQLCDRFHIGMNEKSKRMVIHFHPFDWLQFIARLNEISHNFVLNQIKDKCKNRAATGSVFISLLEQEIADNNLVNFNFYYT